MANKILVSLATVAKNFESPALAQPETGEQLSMPICSVLSCPGIAGNLFLYGNYT